MLTQKACFNSPVWFNVGVKESRGYGWYYDTRADSIRKLDRAESRPQCSACFINSVKDSLESILNLAKTEGMLFKWGSGTGTNLSTLREEDAILSGGGRASGPLSFMKGFDAFAGRDQVRRQDPPRREDGDPERRSPRHREVHLVQGEGREEGAHADRRRLRLLARRRSLQLHLLPERQQLRPRHRRVHAGGDGGPRLVDPVPRHRSAGETLQGARPDAADRRGHVAVRRSRHAVRHHRQPLAHVQEHGAHQRLEPVLASTCSWTIRPATWRR